MRWPLLRPKSPERRSAPPRSRGGNHVSPGLRPPEASGGWLLSAGFVAILEVELHFPEAGSLKGKRKHVLSAKAQLQNRFGASVAEVGHHELWQRCALTAAFAARDARAADELAARAEHWLSGQEWELVRCERTLVSPED